MKRRRAKQSRRSEFDWIRIWQRHQKLPADVLVGIGDDCAVIKTRKRGLLGLLKCDACAEGIHFTPSTDLALVGRKVMARNLSDIAAMGGRPLFALVSVAIPGKVSDSGRMKLFQGLQRLARRSGCELIGGDTSASRAGLFVSVFLYGEVEKKNLLLRSGARPGDAVFVTGRLGGSIGRKHLVFEPRLEEARWLAARFKPTAAIDLSDGLGGDLLRLSEQSGVGFEIRAEKLPRTSGCGVARALYDGEDYELLFTVPPSRGAALQRAWRARFRIPLTRIGTVRPRAFGIQLINLSGRASPIHPSYDHFRRHA